jgi:hypothetical protein
MKAGEIRLRAPRRLLELSESGVLLQCLTVIRSERPPPYFH